VSDWRCVDPYSDPAQNLNADPDPDPGYQLNVDLDPDQGRSRTNVLGMLMMNMSTFLFFIFLYYRGRLHAFIVKKTGETENSIKF
jgi:hypothetical protein